jgi:hypothetical protein
VIRWFKAWARRGRPLATDPTRTVEALTLAEALLVAAVRAGNVHCIAHPDKPAVTVITIDGRPVAVCESCMLGDGGPAAAYLGQVAA